MERKADIETKAKLIINLMLDVELFPLTVSRAFIGQVKFPIPLRARENLIAYIYPNSQFPLSHTTRALFFLTMMLMLQT